MAANLALPALPASVLGFTFELIPMLAQASLDASVDRFLAFLAKVFLLLGALVIAYGGYLLHQGRVSEGLLGLLGGFILALAIPMMRFFIQIAGS